MNNFLFYENVIGHNIKVRTNIMDLISKILQSKSCYFSILNPIAEIKEKISSAFDIKNDITNRILLINKILDKELVIEKLLILFEKDKKNKKLWIKNENYKAFKKSTEISIYLLRKILHEIDRLI